jgi:hypothetical protein
MISDIQDFMNIPVELVQRLLHIAEARGGSIRISDAQRIVPAPWKLLGESGHVPADTLRDLVEKRVSVRTVDSVANLLERVKKLLPEREGAPSLLHEDAKYARGGEQELERLNELHKVRDAIEAKVERDTYFGTPERLEKSVSNNPKSDKAIAEHISEALKDQSYAVRKAATQHPNATPGHISVALKDLDLTVRIAAICHPSATPGHISEALKDQSENVRYSAIHHPNATPGHISEALKDQSENVRLAAIRSHKVTPEHISKVLAMDSDPEIREAAVRHPNATVKNLTIAQNDSHHLVRMAVVYHPRATLEHVAVALRDPDTRVREAAIRQREFLGTPESSK